MTREENQQIGNMLLRYAEMVKAKELTTSQSEVRDLLRTEADTAWKLASKIYEEK